MENLAYTEISYDATHPPEVSYNPNHFPRNPYGYVPTQWICAVFVVLFSLSTAFHVVQAIHTRLWWLFLTVVSSGVLEILGWAGRLWSSRNAYLKIPYLIQIVTTILAPTPLIAANFIVLGQLIRRMGPHYSRLDAKWYTVVFVCCDFIALIVQAIGGGIAAQAVNTNHNPNLGGNIMLGGIAFQMFAITVYMSLAAEFITRLLHNRHLRNPHTQNIKNGQEAVSEERKTTNTLDLGVRLMLLGLTFSSICVYVRSVYRTIELANGWEGYIIHTQRYFNWLDGAMICIAMFSANVLHPGRLLGKAEEWQTIGIARLLLEALPARSRCGKSKAPAHGIMNSEA